jgi:hypothetical protein
LQLALLAQLHDGGGREELAVRRHAELRRGVTGSVTIGLRLRQTAHRHEQQAEHARPPLRR